MSDSDPVEDSQSTESAESGVDASNAENDETQGDGVLVWPT